MKSFFSTVWKVITAPFRFLIWLFFKLPYRTFKRIQRFFTDEPEEQPLIDVFSNTIQNQEAREELWEHVNDLRKHLLRMLIGVAVTTAVSFIFADKLLNLLADPKLIEGGITSLRTLDPTESISVFMKVALLAGFAAAIPYLAFEIYLFIAPGLKARSRLFGLFSIPIAFVLFVAGAYFTWKYMLPAALQFLYNFGKFQQEWTADKFYSLIIAVMFWIGLTFEFPLFVFAFSSIGLLKPKTLLAQWRIAIVTIAIVAALITPTPDPVNMGIVMLPLTLLYFIGVGTSFLAYRKPKEE